MKKNIYDKTHKILVKKLKQARKEMGFDQKDIAKKLNCTQSYISKIESGQVRIEALQLKLLAKIYNKDITEFI